MHRYSKTKAIRYPGNSPFTLAAVRRRGAYVQGGRTGGDAREFLVHNGRAEELGVTDIRVIRF